MSRVLSVDGERRSRAAWYADVTALRAEAHSGLEIARRLGLSSSFVYELLNDPTGAKAQERKLRARGVCVDCGGQTMSRQNPRCQPCERKRKAVGHGVASKYRHGCRCDACTAANREVCRERRHRGGPPPTHGVSGYINYGCRCDVCTAAHTDRLWLGGYRARWAKKVRGTEPPRHGCATAYNSYQCRCDVCRNWRRDEATRRRERKKAAA